MSPDCNYTYDKEISDKCLVCKQPIGNNVFTVCDDCWDIKDDKVKKRITSLSEMLVQRDSELEQARSVDTTDIKNYAVKTACERILDEIAKPSGGRFGSELMNKIVDMVRDKDKEIARLKELLNHASHGIPRLIQIWEDELKAREK